MERMVEGIESSSGGTMLCSRCLGGFGRFVQLCGCGGRDWRCCRCLDVALPALSSRQGSGFRRPALAVKDVLAAVKRIAKFVGVCFDPFSCASFSILYGKSAR